MLEQKAILLDLNTFKLSSVTHSLSLSLSLGVCVCVCVCVHFLGCFFFLTEIFLLKDLKKKKKLCDCSITV